MRWVYGNYPFLYNEFMAENSLSVIDVGVETRQNKSYYYDNNARNYQGYLFQYTLDGYGIYECNGKRYKISKGNAFFISIPENSRYYYMPTEDNSKLNWMFFMYIVPALPSLLFTAVYMN
jgi:AraC-like ligand binding domain.